MIQFQAISTTVARHYQSGGTDAYGAVPERAVSDGDGVPCRHCLQMVPESAAYLIVAHRPFQSLQPYAETGPIFLCAEACARAEAMSDLPEILNSPRYLVRGYGADERIVYGTGGVVERGGIGARADDLLKRNDISFVHVRSAQNNCFQCAVVHAVADGDE